MLKTCATIVTIEKENQKWQVLVVTLTSLIIQMDYARIVI
jgi:hypothetical protein